MHLTHDSCFAPLALPKMSFAAVQTLFQRSEQSLAGDTNGSAVFESLVELGGAAAQHTWTSAGPEQRDWVGSSASFLASDIFVHRRGSSLMTQECVCGIGQPGSTPIHTWPLIVGLLGPP